MSLRKALVSHLKNIYVQIYENPASFNTTSLTFFQENTQAFSLNHPQSTNSLLTNHACVWLVSSLSPCWALAVQGCSAKKTSSLTDEIASLHRMPGHY